MQNSELCIPEAALASSDEGGQAMAPAVGDRASVTIEGTVTRSEGGQVYLKPETANGQPLQAADAADSEMSLDEEGEGLKREMAAYDNSGLMAWAVAFLLLFCFQTAKAAQNTEFANAVNVSGGAVSNVVLFAQPTQVFQVEINNFGSVTNYLLIFDSATNSLVNRTPHFTAVPIPPGKVGGKNWGPSGCPFAYGVNACLSTTPFSLTNAASGGTATIYHKRTQ